MSLALGADPPPPADIWGPLKPNLEVRTWLEHRDGPAFGKNPDYTTLLIRTRFNLEYRATNWFRIGGTFQDIHAPGYFQPTPGSAQNPAELHEAYLEFGAAGDRGWGALAGRRRFFLGSQNLIGLPEWSNYGRTYDAARLFWHNPAMRLEVLYASQVKSNPTAFDKPVLGDHILGTYNTFSKWIPKGKVDLFFLQHYQNAQGGFAGPKPLKTLSYGGRVAGAIGSPWLYDFEFVGQGGEAGVKTHRGFGTNLMVTRNKVFVDPLDWVFEYKYASGTADPTSNKSGTFDQLYPANHDRYGHADLLGFRNVETVRFVNRIHWGKHTTLNVSYANNWVAQARDGMYDLTGKLIASSPNGTAGRHIGQELAFFTMHRFGHFQFGGGYAYWWLGDFARGTTPGVSPRYYYLHQSFVY